MYYIAFFKDLKRNLVLPKKWVKDIKLHKEKFYNNSLNKSQTFMAFYTSNQNAFNEDGSPKIDFPPNFQAPVRNFLDGDGVYRVNLLAYKSSLEGAMSFAARRRNVAPGLYNEDRLREQPIPSECGIGDSERGNNADMVFDGSSEDEDLPSFEEIIIAIPSNENENSSVGTNDTTNPLNLSEANSVDGTEPGQNDSNENEHRDSADETGRAVAVNAENTNTDIVEPLSEMSNGETNATGNGAHAKTVSDEHAISSVENTSQEQSVMENRNDLAASVEAEASNQTDAIQQLPTVSNESEASSSNVTAVFDDNLASNLDETRNDEPNATGNGVHVTVPDEHAISSVENTSQEQIVMENRNDLAAFVEAGPSNLNKSGNIDSKENIVPMYEIHRTNRHNLLEQLDVSTVEIIDGMEVTVTSKEFGRPLNAIPSGLIKQEKPDEISGGIPFMKTKTGRVFEIGQRLIEIPHLVFASFRDWAKPPLNKDIECDKRFVSALLLALVEVNKLLIDDISEDVLQFVEELLKIRCGEEEKRVGAIAEYAKELCAKMRREAQGN